ncbi:MAG: AmmeMemoRadiSam system protein A [Bacteroidetes bacterium]|nr:AmmeMemoRadiSam system protein A [Bacteroidota bacterium]
MELTDQEKKILLNAARESIRSIFSNENLPLTDYQKYPSLFSHKGAFVTIFKNHLLRGCIGYIISNQPLFETVCEAAIQAATEDPRFPSLTENEFENIAIEISILSEPFELNSYDEIEIGKHGLILEEMGRRALLLPQVPIEHNFNKEQFLSALCQKGGFKSDLWKEKLLNLKMFTASVFSEEELDNKNE